MKIVKSLMLGSAAGLIAMSGAQAADLPVKAKAVEYVRICSLYGAGFSEYGVVRTYFDATFSWTTTNANVAGTIGPTQNAGIAGSDTIGVYHAFIQFAGFTLGKTYSQFDAPWYNYPANNFDGLVGGGGDVTGVNQLT